MIFYLERGNCSIMELFSSFSLLETTVSLTLVPYLLHWHSYLLLCPFSTSKDLKDVFLQKIYG
jgi:hypothetical protein